MIIPIGPKQIDLYIKHLHQHMSESGIDDIVYTPYHRGFKHPLKEMKNKTKERLKLKLTELNWVRVFGAFENEKLLGHLDLRGAHLPTSLHRCQLGIGLDKHARGRGLGNELMLAAIEWVKNETELEWIDLNTFSHNKAALELYKKCGFIQVGCVEDMFRVDGEQIADLQMTLKICR